MNRDITFIYSDSAERALYTPIAEEAERRGYKVRMTMDPFAECEIGVYCQHVNFPEFSRFSVIMLHDIIQQYGSWPDIWLKEPWDKYDIGILPSNQWVRNWTEASSLYYTRPRTGVYQIGWPKADVIVKLKDPGSKAAFYGEHGLDPNKHTVLYAPAWENDGKQDDFVQAMLPLGVNILIKQWDADSKKFPKQVENVQTMKKLHEGLPGVTILPPETNIFVAIAASDLLVSEESSTMCEAAMMGIPAVSVSDWLIPDETPSRPAKCNYDFVLMTKKAGLGNLVQDIFDHYEEYHVQTVAFAEENFPNIEKTSGMIMDIIDDCVAGQPVRYPALVPKPKERISAGRYLRHQAFQFIYRSGEKYAKRNRIYGAFWNTLRRIKNGIENRRA